MNTIIIDTADNKQISVGLKINGKEYREKSELGVHKAQVVLPMVEKILKKHGLQPKDITHIEVNEGSGSFTGLRVGVAIANTLAFVLRIPINNKPLGTYVEPQYD